MKQGSTTYKKFIYHFLHYTFKYFELPIIFFSHLKSGMPADVLIPAPVWITVCFVAEIHSASCTTLLPTSSLLSNF